MNDESHLRGNSGKLCCPLIKVNLTINCTQFMVYYQLISLKKKTTSVLNTYTLNITNSYGYPNILYILNFTYWATINNIQGGVNIIVKPY